MSIVSKTILNNIIKAFEGEAQAIAKARATQDKAIQQALDAMLLACTVSKPEFMKGNSKTNEARAEVKAIFDGLAKADFISQKSATQYQSCFWIAFEQGIPFSRDLVNKKSDTKTKGESEAATPKSGKVTSTSRADLDKTLSKAMAQARLLGLTEFAAELVDLCVDRLDGFKETVLDK